VSARSGQAETGLDAFLLCHRSSQVHFSLVDFQLSYEGDGSADATAASPVN
jgi:hypothetical protein